MAKDVAESIRRREAANARRMPATDPLSSQVGRNYRRLFSPEELVRIERERQALHERLHTAD